MYTFRILNNGHEVENIEAGTFTSREEARFTAEQMLPDLCPDASKLRKFYRVEVVLVPPAKVYHVVTKTDKGYRIACGFSFPTLAEAVEWRDRNHAAGKVATEVPGYIGDGWFSLNPANIVA